MHDSTNSAPAATALVATDLPQRLAQRTATLLEIVADFLARPLTAEATFAWEKKWPTSCGR